MLVSVVGTVAAQSVLLTQHFSGPTTGPAAGSLIGCRGGNIVPRATGIPADFAPGQGIIFDCGGVPPPLPGETANSGLRTPAILSEGGTFSATFDPSTLPLPYTNLGLVRENLYGRTCTTDDFALDSNGNPIDLGTDTSSGPATLDLPAGVFNYCAIIDMTTVNPCNCEALPGFSVSWGRP